jgi:hypothetical protein
VNGTTRAIRRRLVWRPTGRIAAVVVAVAAIGVPAPAYGSSLASTVAGRSAHPEATYVQDELAFSRCMRAHGLRNWPNPNSNGNFPASTKQIAATNHRFRAAWTACHHLLPAGPQPHRLSRHPPLPRAR